MNESASSVAPGQAVIVFDGICVLCNGWVKFLLRRDRRGGRYRFAAMQGQTGRALLAAHALDPDDPCDSQRARSLPSEHNGNELCGKAMAHARGVQLRLIEPGKPNQNACIDQQPSTR